MNEKVITNQAADPMVPVTMPEQFPAAEQFAVLPGTRLWYSDTGGDGEPVVFLHPAASGNPLLWGYQQPVFAKAGYRVICYARRGYYQSDPPPRENPGIASEDLHGLIGFLNLGKVHLVSSAAGGSVAADYALSHPDRLLSLVISNNYAGVREGYIREAADAIRPEQWNDLPRWFREIGPSYLAANPEGVKQWVALADRSSAKKGIDQKSAHAISAKKLEEIIVPTLLFTGMADLTSPPSLMRMVAKHIRGSELVIVAESGHSLYWEQPEVFNRTVVDFLARHPR